MKTSVRFLSMLLAVLMIASAALTASAADAETTANSEALQLLVDLGIFGGYDDGSLKPDQLVERDEMAKIIFVLYTTFSDAGTGVASFKDVAVDNWANGYISWCSSRGIVGGYGDGNFGPDDHVTYDQALKMVCGALGYNEWDSKLWPTDVRTLALNTLNLGENIKGVKGSDEITRAQVAQIVYNALFADMNETKLQERELIPGTGILVKLPVAKTLAVDVWKFSEVVSYIETAGKIGYGKLQDEDADVSIYELGEFSLEDLGLEEYANDVESLFNANVRIIYKSDAGEITAETIVATSVTLTAEEATITYDELKDEITINDVEVEADDNVVLFYTNDGIIADTVPLNPQNVPEKDSLYTALAYDYDEDGDYEAVVWEYLAALYVESATDKKVSVSLYGTDIIETFNVDEIDTKVALEEDDVIVASFLFDKFKVVEKVEPVVAAATRYSGTKLTLTDVGEVAINDVVFVPNGVCVIDSSVMNLNDKGETEKSTYYIYDGKVFGADIVVDESDLQFAIINYFNEPSEPKLNETTMEFTTSYTAVVTIDGKQQTVNVNPADSIDGLKLNDATEKATILESYGKAFVDAEGNIGATGKYLYNRYILASYKVNEDGYYSFTTNAEHEDYVKYPAGSVIKYNKATGLYNIYDAEGDLLTARVRIDDAATIYYTYKKVATGEYVYLGTYAKANLPENLDSITAKSPIYATYNEENKFSTVKLLVTDEDAITKFESEKADYRTDAREFFYCYQSSNQAMADDQKNLVYTHFMRSVYNGTNLAETPNKDLTAAEGAIGTTQGFLYAWDDEAKNYIKVTNANLESLGITSLGAYTLDEIVNGYIVTNEEKFGTGIKIDDGASMWALGGTAASIAVLDMAGVQKSIDINKEYNAYHGTNEPQRMIIGTRINDEGEEVACVIIFQQFVYDAAGNPARNTTSLIYTNFGY